MYYKAGHCFKQLLLDFRDCPKKFMKYVSELSVQETKGRCVRPLAPILPWSSAAPTN